MTDRILWNRRPTDEDQGGDIDEIVLENVKMVHIEQMDENCWWIAFYMGENHEPYWMGNFIIDTDGKMRFYEQENAGVEWERDNSHDD